MSDDEKCPKCNGCGQIGTDDEETPWSVWLSLPLGSSLAVLSGLVRPIPCPVCGGTGKRPDTAPEPAA